MIARSSNFKRGASKSPACGPEPVTNVPITITINVRRTCTCAKIFTLVSVGRIEIRGDRQRATIETAPAMRNMERIAKEGFDVWKKEYLKNSFSS